jgi:hypothetical protein
MAEILPTCGDLHWHTLTPISDAEVPAISDYIDTRLRHPFGKQGLIPITDWGQLFSTTQR